MKQKKIVITVTDSDGVEIFHKDPAHPDHVPAALTLYGEAGNSIRIDIVEIILPEVSQS